MIYKLYKSIHIAKINKEGNPHIVFILIFSNITVISSLKIILSKPTFKNSDPNNIIVDKIDAFIVLIGSILQTLITTKL